MSTTWIVVAAPSGLAAHSSAARPRASSGSSPRWWSRRGVPELTRSIRRKRSASRTRSARSPSSATTASASRSRRPRVGVEAPSSRCSSRLISVRVRAASASASRRSRSSSTVAPATAAASHRAALADASTTAARAARSWSVRTSISTWWARSTSIEPWSVRSGTSSTGPRWTPPSCRRIRPAAGIPACRIPDRLVGPERRRLAVGRGADIGRREVAPDVPTGSVAVVADVGVDRYGGRLGLPVHGVAAEAASTGRALAFGDPGPLPIEHGRQLGQQAAGQFAQVGMARAAHRRYLDERVAGPGLQGDGLGRTFELFDQSADVADGGLRGAEGGETRRQHAAVVVPQQVLTDVPGDGAVTGHQRTRREQGGGVGQRRPAVGVGEYRERPLLRGQGQGLCHSGLAGLRPDEGHRARGPRLLRRRDVASRGAPRRRLQPSCSPSDLSAPSDAFPRPVLP